MTIKLYKVNVHQAYRADETGIRWFEHKPADTEYYKHEILEEIDAVLPEGITYNSERMTFSDRGNDCQMVTEHDGSAVLVSSERIIYWIK